MRLVHELTPGEDYDLIVTTVGGLVRYRIGDRVRCCSDGRRGNARSDRTPALRFVGRSGRTTDLVGEKLTEDFVLSCLDDLAGAAVLVAASGQWQDGPARYVVLVDAAAPLAPARLDAIEVRLRRNPQYAHARGLGQLGPLEARAVPGLVARHAAARLAAGQRLGDIKPPALLDEDDVIWPDPPVRR